MSYSRVGARVSSRAAAGDILGRVLEATDRQRTAEVLERLVRETEAVDAARSRARRVWTDPVRAGARQVFIRSAGGPLPAILWNLWPHLVRAYPHLSYDQLLLLLREMGQQMQGYGTAEMRQPALRRFAGAGGLVDPGGWEEWTQELADLFFQDYEGNNGTPEFWRRNVLSMGIRDTDFTAPEFQVTFPYTGTVLGETVTGWGPNPYSFDPAAKAMERSFRWLGSGAPIQILPELGQPPILSRPGLGDAPTSAARARRSVRRLGLPLLQGGERNTTWPTARRQQLLKAALGLYAEFAPAAGPRPPARTTDGVQVFPAVRPAEPHRFERPSRNVRERKIRVSKAWVATSLVIGAVTETGDLIESVWKALPERFKTARTSDTGNRRFDRMLGDIWAGFDHILWDEALVHFVFNQLEDLWYGAQGQAAREAGARLRRGGGQGGIGTDGALNPSHDAWGQVGGDDPVRAHEADPVNQALDKAERWAIESLRGWRGANRW